MSDLSIKAYENFTCFVKTLKKLITTNDNELDLIIGPGDSGIAMVHISIMVFNILDITPPNKLVIPYYRYQEKDSRKGKKFEGNNTMIPDIQKALEGTSALTQMLFVDDEIGTGSTIEGVINLINLSKENILKHQPTLFIIAENHGFQPNDNFGSIKIIFLPFAQKTKSINNAISYMIPPNIESQILQWRQDSQSDLNDSLERLNNPMNSKELFNSLLNLPIKSLSQHSKPVWSYKFLNRLKTEIPNFTHLQKEFTQYLQTVIKTTLNHDS